MKLIYIGENTVFRYFLLAYPSPINRDLITLALQEFVLQNGKELHELQR